MPKPNGDTQVVQQSLVEVLPQLEVVVAVPEQWFSC